MQSVDFTTLIAARAELRDRWIPARIEQIYQRDRYTIALSLRTLQKRDWLNISWHPQAARICIGDPPPRVPDTFTFSDQLRHQLNGLALTNIATIAPWERVLDLQFAKRPGEEVFWHLYVEIMGKYSNVILTDAKNQVVTCARQISGKQSSLRTIQTGKPYDPPPILTESIPRPDESFQRWQERVSLVPGILRKQLLGNYRGLSPVLVKLMIQTAQIDPEQSTETLQESDWKNLFQSWQTWLQALEGEDFQACWIDGGYSVLNWGDFPQEKNVQTLLNRYYTDRLNEQTFKQLRHQFVQKLGNLLGKLRQKARIFETRLQQSDEADEYRQKADLLMAYLQEWEPGMKSIVLEDFATGEPVTLTLNPEKNAVQNAQALYKKHQKLKRARTAVEPLLQEVREEIDYLEQVEATAIQVETYRNPEDLQALEEIREELIAQGYLEPGKSQNRTYDRDSQPYRYQTPSGFELWIGRNNRQNDKLTFRTAGEYDLWFHTQEIAGSHVLLRLEPGTVPDEEDLQFAADFAAYYSRGRNSDAVPVVYARPKYVYKPKGAKPGMAIYKQETVIWARSRRAEEYLNKAT
ncbi:NFACT family protein [Lusitaniella coriacea LEGE 07157]|uniref:Rqc2 homolog RqcH n=1 Tax=Lusitaniella coriacea LEGE 07157 TaxID=945747 RepID=A0A8J7DYH5_9CYAN|nr:NFACT RNA binding domain-containing protein [Lusitaniella coriacea]MBE9116021.1 NFACT family protein [Lusitaniella coriacea LEGE 07157]